MRTGKYHGTVDELNRGIPAHKEGEGNQMQTIDGIKFVLETEHSSRAKLNKYLGKISGTVHIKRTAYGTWQTFRLSQGN